MKERYKLSSRVVKLKDLSTQRGAVRIPKGFLTVTCYCERYFVNVSESDVFEGRTASCGHKDCHA